MTGNHVGWGYDKRYKQGSHNQPFYEPYNDMLRTSEYCWIAAL
jgi:hypothetical protein